MPGFSHSYDLSIHHQMKYTRSHDMLFLWFKSRELWSVTAFSTCYCLLWLVWLHVSLLLKCCGYMRMFGHICPLFCILRVLTVNLNTVLFMTNRYPILHNGHILFEYVYLIHTPMLSCDDILLFQCFVLFDPSFPKFTIGDCIILLLNLLPTWRNEPAPAKINIVHASTTTSCLIPLLYIWRFRVPITVDKETMSRWTCLWNTQLSITFLLTVSRSPFQPLL